MRKNTINLLLLLFTAVMLITGCKKVPGPAGPTGNANVQSAIFTINTWSTTSSPYNHYYVDMPMTELTSANINTASVMTYIGTGSGTWVAVPYTEYHWPSDYHMGFRTSVGNVEITWVYDGSGYGDSPNTFYGVAIQAKVVVIPPAAMAAHPEVDIKNYKQVKNTFGLAD